MPTTLSFVIRKGSTLRRTITWYSNPVFANGRSGEIDAAASTPMDLTGYSARMHVRTRAKDLIFELTTENGGITLGDASGTITFFLDHTDTESTTETRLVYDFELVAPDGDVTPLLAGGFSLSEQVTV